LPLDAEDAEGAAAATAVAAGGLVITSDSRMGAVRFLANFAATLARRAAVGATAAAAPLEDAAALDEEDAVVCAAAETAAAAAVTDRVFRAESGVATTLPRGVAATGPLRDGVRPGSGTGGGGILSASAAADDIDAAATADSTAAVVGAAGTVCTGVGAVSGSFSQTAHCLASSWPS
jgi:hypothetical protein